MSAPVQKLNGPKRVDVRPNQTFEISTSGEKGFWEVEARSDGGSTTDYWVLSIPQDEDQETLIAYEVRLGSQLLLWKVRALTR